MVGYSYKNTIEANTVNGKPLVYFEEAEDINIEDAGQVILVKCKNITVTNLNLSNTSVGAQLLDTKDSTILNNKVNNNSRYGIKLTDSNNNTIFNNEISHSNHWLNSGIKLWNSSSNTLSCNDIRSNYNGIYFDFYSRNNTINSNNITYNEKSGISIVYSRNNTIYRNNFINNSDNAYSDSINIWNSTEKITYTYDGNTYANYMGNYWDDYEGADANKDGIGDTPYSIDSDEDFYPLMEHWENYFAPTGNIFDTGTPANPYPSIMGNHTGTIKPNHTVIATKLYTYSCVGTGGHTEYAEIRNATWNATATWEGYAGDWHNITFDKTVVLLANKTYNYTIRTGSYPQIHHTDNLEVANDMGTITCDKFVDANGRIYHDWIPAIRLWS